MAENLDYYNAALAGKAPPISPDHPHAGRYRMRAGKGGPYLPVIIHTPKGETELAALIGPRAQAKTRPAVEVWTYCGDKPVTEEAFRSAFETGVWPGDAPEIGDNSGNADLSLAEQIKEYATMAVEWLAKLKYELPDATAKDRAANMRQHLLDLRKRADIERETEKRPHLEAGRAVDAKFKPIIEEADAAANDLRDALTTYMREEEAKLRAEQDAARKAEAARVTAENKRIEDERAALMRDDPIAALTSDEPELLPPPPPSEPVRVQAGGQRGRRTGLRTVTKYVVTDFAAALAHCKDHPAIREAVEKVCCAQAKAGAVVPGVEAREEKVAA
jgi:hypothetical protein